MNTKQNKPLSLHAVVRELLSCYGSVHPQHSAQIVNAVSREFKVTRSKNWLSPLMGDLFAILSASGGEEIVYISAKPQEGAFRLYGVVRKKAIADARLKAARLREAMG